MKLRISELRKIVRETMAEAKLGIASSASSINRAQMPQRLQRLAHPSSLMFTFYDMDDAWGFIEDASNSQFEEYDAVSPREDLEHGEYTVPLLKPYVHSAQELKRLANHRNGDLN